MVVFPATLLKGALAFSILLTGSFEKKIGELEVKLQEIF